MVSNETFRKSALSFEGTSEQPHFQKASFRANKKIFATLDEEKRIATLCLSEMDQDVFCTYDRSVIYPVPNKWGKQGWTFVELKTVSKAMLADLLGCAYKNVNAGPGSKKQTSK